MINELFLPGVMGDDMKSAVLSLMNGIKVTGYFPPFTQLADICTIFKNKGSRLEMSSDRGVFILVILRKILDKLIYGDKYDHIARGMSDSNIGAQRKKNIKNHLFVVHGVINAVIKDGKSCIDIQIYDLVQAFDALWLADCMNDLYDTIPAQQRDEKLALMYEGNKTTAMAVNTPVGQTQRVLIDETVQQGGVFGPIMCSNTIDKVGQKCYNRGENLYLYKNRVNVLPLAMCDDLLGISACSQSSLSLNTFINAQIELKKLKFHTPDKNGKTKCHKMHVGIKNKFCPQLKVHGTDMQKVDSDVYLGEVLSADGKNNLNIKNRIGRGLGKITEIMNILEKVTLGEHYFATAVLLRESMFLSSVLSSAEVLYGLSKDHIDELEDLDLSLLRKIMDAPCSIAKEAIYLELGILNIGALIKARRLNYLHYLVKRNPTEMIFKFFTAQWNNECKDDWTVTVRKDLEDIGLAWDLNFIKSKSDYSFKSMIKRRIREYAFYSFLEKKESHTKLDGLFYPELKMQEYLRLGKMSAFQAKEIFSYRTRSAQYSANYPGSDGLKPCPLCFLHLDCQPMTFQCPLIKENVTIKGKYSDIFQSDVSSDIAKTIQSIQEFRNNFLLNRNLM